jgi:RNA polymerase sigma-70 factor (ECF subfamily)
MADYDRIRSQLARAVRQVCPRSLADRSEDIVQNAMVRIFEIQKRGELNGSPPASYLWRAAYTATIDQIRDVRRRREDALDAEDLERKQKVADDPVLRERAGWDQGRAVRSCLGSLQERRRIVVGLYLLGHPLSECVDLVGWRFNQVRNLLYRGLADLRRCLASKGVTP